MENMVTIEELEKCKTYVDGLRLIGINYNTSASKQKLYNICKRLNFDFDLHIQKQKHIRVCKNCGKILKKGQKKFCSCSCSATYNNILREPKSENTRKKIGNDIRVYTKLCLWDERLNLSSHSIFKFVVI